MKFNHNGEYELKIKIHDLKENLSPIEIHKNYLLDENSMKKVTPQLKKQVITQFKESKNGSFGFKLQTTLTKFGIQKKLTFNCHGHLTINNLKQHCVFNSIESDKDILDFGTQSVSCQTKECEFTYTGKPHGVNYLVLQRTPLRLAISGAAETLISTKNLALELSSSHPSDIDQFNLMNIESFWKTTEKLSQKLVNSQILEVRSNAQGFKTKLSN